MFVASGSCFAVAAAALVFAFASARLYDWRRAAGAGGLGALLIGAGVGLFWVGSAYPTFNVRNNQGFPPDWSCAPIGRGPVCAQDVPRSGTPPSQAR